MNEMLGLAGPFPHAVVRLASLLCGMVDQ